MSSQAYHDKVNQRYNDPDGEAWHNRAEFMGKSLDEKMGTAAADAWEEREFPEGAPTWKALAVAITKKLEAISKNAAYAPLDPAAEKALHTLDWDSIEPVQL